MAYGLTKAWRKWSKLEDLRNGKSSLCLQKTKVTKNPCFEQKVLHTSTTRESTTMKMSTDWLTDRLFGLLGQMIYGQKFQKVENDENRYFAITSSKLFKNWFCKGHIFRNNIFHNHCFLYVLKSSLIFKKNWFLCFLLKFATKKQSKKMSFSTSELGS